jgi:flagellin-like protein
MLIKNKKGISPLIATVLIIAITIFLAAFIFPWIINLFTGQTDDIDCSLDASNKCTTLSGDLSGTIIENSTTFNYRVVINSLSSENLSNVVVIFYKEDGSSGNISNQQIGPYSNVNFNVVGGGSAGYYTKVKLFPVVSSDEGKGCEYECSEIELEIQS